MEGMKLMEPGMEFDREVQAYRQEFLQAGGSMDGCGSLRRFDRTEDWLAQVESLKHEETVPANLVPMTQFIFVREAEHKIVGVIQIRHRFNEYLEKYAGHIGYSVAPSERRKGYATQMLKEVLPLCKASGLSDVMVACLVENEASRRTILKNGGIYERTVHEPSKNVDLEHYWIHLNHGAGYTAEDLTEQQAREVFDWQYEGEYAVYNFPSWEQGLQAGWAITDAKRRKNAFFSLLLDGKYLGYFHIMTRQDHVELGVGLRPEKCGQHHGPHLMACALAKIRELHPGMPVQLSVRTFNRRAIACYEKAGFRITETYRETRSPEPAEMYRMVFVDSGKE